MSRQSITIKTIKLAQPNEFKNEHLRVEVLLGLRSHPVGFGPCGFQADELHDLSGIFKSCLGLLD